MNHQDDKSCPVVLLGAGGHAGVVLDALRLIGVDVAGVCDPVLSGAVASTMNLPVIDGDRLTDTHPPEHFRVANGVGMMPGQQNRRDLFHSMQTSGYRFITVAHISSIVADTACVGEGAQIMAGVIVQDRVTIGEQTIVNTGAQIDHGCRVGSMVHICPGAVLSGDVVIGDDAFIGAGAIIINGVEIGARAVIGAGAVITRNVLDDTRIVTPASRDLAP